MDSEDSPLVAALRRAVTAAPDDVELRLHLAQTLLDEGRGDDAVAEAAVVLQRDATEPRARELMVRALPAASGVPTVPVTLVDHGDSSTVQTPRVEPQTIESQAAESSTAELPTAELPTVEPQRVKSQAVKPEVVEPGVTDGFDWSRAEAEIDSKVAPPFVAPNSSSNSQIPPDQPNGGHFPAFLPPPDSGAAEGEGDPVLDFAQAPANDSPVYEVERPRLSLGDVGGMFEVKQRLEAAFLAPLRNPELRRMYGKSLRGGLLMYGPPGCGKTFIARALAGELGAGFLSLGVADVADVYRGGMERNVHEFFQFARRNAPVVVFLDELDAIGQRRTTHNSWNGVVNVLLTELDGVDAGNEGIYVLGASNQPWQIDPALRRPGRFDRTVLVLPPDEPARREIFRHHLQDRPIAGIDLDYLAGISANLTGADIALVCETAVEQALMDSVTTGQPRYVQMGDMLEAMKRARNSIGPWLETARNVVAYGDDDGTFAELKGYLKSVNRL